MSTPSSTWPKTSRSESTGAQASPETWPAPTMKSPKAVTMAAWYFDQGGSKATDGCWVAIDGVCPHGHPSWFIQMGLIERA
jgi:hypothetical protein